MTDPGHVYDICSGRRIGKTADLWVTFTEHAARVRERGPCYIVAADVPANVRNALAALGIPIVGDARFARGALLLEGAPAEWEESSEEERAEVRGRLGR